VAGSPRCPSCGKRAVGPVEPAAEVENKPRLITGRLTEIEIEVLVAAAESEEPRIHAYRPKGSGDGEIKAGASRIAGNGAVAAVNRLQRAGLVEQLDDASFALTPAGLRAAIELHHARRS